MNPSSRRSLGYKIVLRDLAFVGFILTGMIVLIVYQQQYSSLPVYLRDVHDINTRSYGVMLSITGLEVVLFQFWISRKIRTYSPFLMMMLSAIFLTVGFGMIGFVSGLSTFPACSHHHHGWRNALLPYQSGIGCKFRS